MAEGLGSDKRFTTRSARIALWSFAAGVATAVMGVNIEWGDIGPWAQRVGNGVEAIRNPPETTTTVPVVTP